MSQVFFRIALCAAVVIGTGQLAGVPAAQAQSGICTGPFETVALPLTELGSQPYVRMDGQVTEFTGGLYPQGSNLRPPEHEAAGLVAASRITTLDQQGNPDPRRGRILMLSIGMSNTSEEFGAFMSLARSDTTINPSLIMINGALSGQTADKWVDPDALAWQELANRIARYELSPLQVQVAWVKLTLTRGGDFPAKAQELQANLELIAQHLKAKYPNLQIAYFSSRTRSYTYERGLSPEPLAYETGFSVKWMIEKQIQGDPTLIFDPAQGAVRAPYLAWGPYLWADGQNARADGFTWLAEDMTTDCTHPSPAGRQKVAGLLLDFFKHDTSTQSWFLAEGAPPVSATATRAATRTTIPSSVSTLSPSQTSTPLLATSTRQVTAEPSPEGECPASAPCPSLTPAASGGEGNPGSGRIFLAIIVGGIFFSTGWWVLRRKT